MIETLWMIEPWHWLVLGFTLMIAEMFIPTFASLWFGTAAVIVAALSWLLPIPLLFQVLIWLTLSVLFLFVWIKYIKPLSIDRTKVGLAGNTIIGETGMIVAKPQDNVLGTVRFNVPIAGADEWSCRTQDDVVEIGDRVVVTDIIGNELMVALTKRIAAPSINDVHSIVRPDITATIANRPIVERAELDRLSLNKPDLDSVRFKKKFIDK